MSELDPAADVHALKRFAVLNLQEGDTLVYLYPDYLAEGMRKRLKDALGELFPGVRCVVLDGGASFAVLRGVLVG